MVYNTFPSPAVAF